MNNNTVKFTAKLATILLLLGITACSSEVSAEDPTTFICKESDDGWATYAQRRDNVSPSPLFVWQTDEFFNPNSTSKEKKWTPEARCIEVTKRLTEAVKTNGGRLSNLTLKTGTINNYPVLCYVKNYNKYCYHDKVKNRTNILFKLKKENGGKEKQIIAKITNFSRNPSQQNIIWESGDTVIINFPGLVDIKMNEIIVTSEGKQHTEISDIEFPVEDVDLAIMRFTSEENYQIAKLDNSTKSLKRTVYVVGFPETNKYEERSFRRTKGNLYLANPQGEYRNSGYFLTYRNDTLPGMSGGGIFNENGKIIGIHTANSFKDESEILKKERNYGVPIEFITIGVYPPPDNPEFPIWEFIIIALIGIGLIFLLKKILSPIYQVYLYVEGNIFLVAQQYEKANCAARSASLPHHWTRR